MTDQRNPSDLFGKGIKLCYCGENASSLPAVPLSKHSPGCLIWDWAMAHKMITPKERGQQLDAWDRQLGVKDARKTAE